MRKSTYYCLLLLLFCSLSATAAASELYVSPDADVGLSTILQNAKSGDVIYLAAGLYEEEPELYPILIDRSITLIGEADTVLSGVPFKPFFQISAPDVTIQNIDFQIKRTGILNTGDRLSVLNCRFFLADEKYRVSSCAIWLAGAKNCTILDCDFRQCSIAMAGTPLSEQSQGRPVLTGLFEVGEDPDFFTTHTVQDNTVNGKPLYYFSGEKHVNVPEDAGAIIAAGCENISIRNVDVSNASMGLELAYCDGAKIENVIADRDGIFGVYLAYSDDAVLKDIVCRESNHGIDIRASRGVAVLNSRTVGCEQGIFLSFATDCVVDSCSVTGGGNGFFVASGARNQLSGNTIEASSNGIYCQGERDVLVCGNTFLHNSTAGLRFLRSSGQILANSLLENWVGVLVAESGPITIWNNRFDSNQCTGLYLRDVTSGKVTFNTFEHMGLADLEVEGSLTDMLILEGD
jgi:parallel beta-helix repeat protein